MERDKCLCNCKRKDVCNEAICGRPENLSIYAPVIYDEIGVNVCRQFTLSEEVIENFPTTECITADIIDISLESEDPKHRTCITETSRPNCSKVTLTNVKITARIKLYDECGKYLGCTIVIGNYLPGCDKNPDYNHHDEKTNPSNVTFDIFTPLGVGLDYQKENYINVVGLCQGKNQIVNGVNISGTCKAMNYDSETRTFSLGLSLILRTVYFDGYEIEYVDKTHPVKAKTAYNSERVCLKFVESGLLSKEIKPLELNQPKCEGRLKDEKKKCNMVRDCKYHSENGCQADIERENNQITDDEKI